MAKKIQECEEAGMEFEETIKTVEAFIDEMCTYFVLEDLDHLRKNGRLSTVKAFVASALILSQCGRRKGCEPTGRSWQEECKKHSVCG